MVDINIEWFAELPGAILKMWIVSLPANDFCILAVLVVTEESIEENNQPIDNAAPHYRE
jgi:hypothetical protein